MREILGIYLEHGEIAAALVDADTFFPRRDRLIPSPMESGDGRLLLAGHRA